MKNLYQENFNMNSLLCQNTVLYIICGNIHIYVASFGIIDPCSKYILTDTVDIRIGK